ncbi:Homeodomain-interacting protein kinase 2 [Collichthys lucidus]|uniref:Homeodomain-interacting protein kinase 2 n=1 Tax=Collichthys lucidus TaxID=240159 RepID=A0A4U5US33_COLLU|nr:Homeodomain-interacting protein kinase 2 [Collichthys lucidus]
MSFSTSTSGNSNKNNDDTPYTAYKVQKHHILISNTTCYQVLDFIGEGVFGRVARCRNQKTGNQVAVKIQKNNKYVTQIVQDEIKILQAIRCLDPEKNSIVNFIEDFRFNNLFCLAFEMLDRSLWDLIEERGWIPLSLNEIRPVTHQLMVALDALKSIGILHTDLKPDNIMLVNHRDQPFKIKLIDFGLARRVCEVPIGAMMQPCIIRAPEVTLGLPLTEAVDMWGVGCLMAFLYFGRRLFPVDCPYNLIRCIVHLLGQPADHLLSAGVYSRTHFRQNADLHSWRMKLPEEFHQGTGIQPQLNFTFFDFVENLEDAVEKYPAKTTDIEFEDRMAFLSLLKSTLELDPERRVTPRDSFKNPFLSMVHLEKNMDNNSYLDEALQWMTILPLNHLDLESDSDDSGDSVPNFRDEDNTKTTDPTKPSLDFDDSCSEKRPSTSEELQVAHVINKKKFTDELQAEKNKNKLLQEEMQQLRNSHQLLIARYEDEITKHADALQHDLDNEILQKNHLQADFDEAIAALQEEREKNISVQHQLDKTIVSLHEAENKNKLLQEQLEPHISYQQLIARYEDDVSRIRRQAVALQHDLDLEILQKNHLQADFDEATAALQEEREKNISVQHQLDKTIVSLHEAENKNKLLQEQLEPHISYQQLIARYEDDVSRIRRQAVALQHDLDLEILQKNHLQADFDEATAALQEEREKNISVQHQLDKTIVSLHEAENKNKQHESIANVEPHEPTKEAEVQEEMPCEEQETISPAPALESQQGAEGNLPQRTAEPPSVWKRVRHFLGLRKPERWKRRRRE